MKRERKHNPIRDFFLAVLLILLIKPALYLSAKRLQSEKNGSESTFLVHKLDPDVMRAFEIAENQLQRTVDQSIFLERVAITRQLKKLARELISIKKRYTKNSPALLFLGPFGSMSIVLKELELEKKLSSIVEILNQTLHKLSGSTPQLTHKETNLVAHLKENQHLLRGLLHA